MFLIIEQYRLYTIISYSPFIFADSKINEESSLLQFNPSSVELKEIRYSENEDLSLRKV